MKHIIMAAIAASFATSAVAHETRTAGQWMDGGFVIIEEAVGPHVHPTTIPYGPWNYSVDDFYVAFNYPELSRATEVTVYNTDTNVAVGYQNRWASIDPHTGHPDGGTYETLPGAIHFYQDHVDRIIADKYSNVSQYKGQWIDGDKYNVWHGSTHRGETLEVRPNGDSDADPVVAWYGDTGEWHSFLYKGGDAVGWHSSGPGSHPHAKVFLTPQSRVEYLTRFFKRIWTSTEREHHGDTEYWMTMWTDFFGRFDIDFNS